MSADYPQPAKHEKSAENPILARLGLELGKPHLLDWSSGPTFFWEVNKLHLGFRFDCVVKKVQIDFCWFAAWYWKRIDWGLKWLDQRQLVGSKILGQRSQFGSFLQQKLGQFFSFHNGRLKRKVGMRCNVQNECKNLRAQKIIIFPFNQRCMYFCHFCLLSWICIHISIYVGFDLSLTAVGTNRVECILASSSRRNILLQVVDPAFCPVLPPLMLSRSRSLCPKNLRQHTYLRVKINHTIFEVHTYSKKGRVQNSFNKVTESANIFSLSLKVSDWRSSEKV